ncbi:MAG: hypothetical protein AB1480_17205 [Nitrospirota bacterium]
MQVQHHNISLPLQYILNNTTTSVLDKKVKDGGIKALMDAKYELNPEHLIILTEDEEGVESAASLN